MRLPIELIPDTDPPLFRWTRAVDGIAGEMQAAHEGAVPPHLEGALVALIKVATKLNKDNERLCAQLLKCQERVAELSKPAVVNPNEPAQRQRPKPERGK